MQAFDKDECRFSQCRETGFNHSTCPNGCNDACVDIDWTWAIKALRDRADTGDLYIKAAIEYLEEI